LLERKDAVARETDYRQLVLTDPQTRALHLQLLEEVPPPAEIPREQLIALADAARRGDTKTFSRQDWVALLSDSESLATVANGTAET
jgi:hypothetical protein